MMAYKILTDGNGGKLIRVVGMGDYMPFSEYDKVQAERDTLAEKVEGSHQFIESLMDNIGAGATISEVADMLCEWWDEKQAESQVGE